MEKEQKPEGKLALFLNKAVRFSSEFAKTTILVTSAILVLSTVLESPTAKKAIPYLPELNYGFFTSVLWFFLVTALTITATMHWRRIGEVIEITWLRYKTEATLALLAIGFFMSLVLPSIWDGKWNDPSLRTQFYALFGLVGLIGLSVGIKRNELMTSEQTERIIGESLLKIERNDEYAMKQALMQITMVYQSSNVSKETKAKLENSLAIFALSTITQPTQLDMRKDVEDIIARNKEIDCRQLALDALKKLINDENKTRRLLKAHYINQASNRSLEYLFVDKNTSLDTFLKQTS